MQGRFVANTSSPLKRAIEFTSDALTTGNEDFEIVVTFVFIEDEAPPTARIYYPRSVGSNWIVTGHGYSL